MNSFLAKLPGMDVVCRVTRRRSCSTEVSELPGTNLRSRDLCAELPSLVLDAHLCMKRRVHLWPTHTVNLIELESECHANT